MEITNQIYDVLVHVCILAAVGSATALTEPLSLTVLHERRDL